MIHSSLHCRHLWESTGRGGAKTGVVGSKSRVDPRFQNLSFCDVTRYPTTPVFVCSKMPHFMYMEKNRGRLKSTPVFLPHETFKNSGSGRLTFINNILAHFYTILFGAFSPPNLHELIWRYCTGISGPRHNLLIKLFYFSDHVNFIQKCQQCASFRKSAKYQSIILEQY